MATRITTMTAAAVLAASGLVACGPVSGDEGDNTTIVTAMFADVSPMVPGNVVKASGIKVGTIEDIDLEDGLARVSMRVEEGVLPLHEDATVKVVTQDLLGERFLELDRGTASAPPLGADEVIDIGHTRRVVDLDQVLNAMDDPTGAAFAALLSTLGEGVAGNGRDVKAALRALAPAMRNTQDLSAVLDEQNDVLGQLVSQTAPVAKALASERGDNLDRLVESGTATLDAVARQRQQAAAALQEMPATLAQARQSMARVAGVADDTAATLRGMRPFTDQVSDISRELRDYSAAADPALTSLRPVLRRGQELIDEAAPLVRALSESSGSLRSVSRSARTLTDQALSKRLTNLMEFVKGWSLATTDYDAISHYFKAIVPVSPKVLGQVGVGPVPGAESPVPNLPLPEPPSLPLPGAGSGGLLGLGQPDDAKPDGGGTGLTEKQENSLLNQLLGGAL